MEAMQVQRFLEPTIARAGFKLDKIDESTSYQGRPAWVIYYSSDDCKLQISWSARDGGIDFSLAPLDAPNEFGLLNKSKKWHLMLMLSKMQDNLETPGPDADDETEIAWLKALFDIHIGSARAALPSKM